MELIQIRYFITAAQFQNLSKAAHILHITQPALSKSIAKLEDELGVCLFDRSGKKITLNERGEKFLDYAITSLQELDDAVAAVKSQTPSPALYFGLLHYSEKFLHCLGAFSKENPNVSFHLEQLDMASHNIDTNEFDMLLYPQSPLFHKYKGYMIYSDPYFLAVHKSNPLACKGSIQLSDVSEQTIIFLKHGNKLFDLPYHLCVSLGIHVNDGMFTNNYETQRWLVSNNHGSGFVSQGSTSSYATDPDIVLLPVSDKGLSQDIMIGFKRQKHLSADGKRFADFVRAYFGI
ncbi:MAG: LysR family transcriptional regulator [Oscillospiraceae bacterium]|nr:LysR family transcriptional regulator [Oscillospiraceae bacterium]